MFSIAQKHPTQIACQFDSEGYSFSSVKDNKTVLFSIHHDLKKATPEQLIQALSIDVERLNLIGRSCHLILSPSQYQLITMDALDVPEHELAKALRWKLKGLVDYPLNDIAIDTFLIPPHGLGNQKKKVFVAVAPMSMLNVKFSILKGIFMRVESVSIPELAFRNLLALLPNSANTSVITLLKDKNRCQIQIIYCNQIYLIRELSTLNDPQNTMLEIQRSIDFCLSELKIAEPKTLIFSPTFYNQMQLLEQVGQELNKEVILFDLNQVLESSSSIALKDQQELFYSIGGALSYLKPLDEAIEQ